VLLTVDIKDPIEASEREVAEEIASWLADLYKTEVFVCASISVRVGGSDGVQTKGT